MLTRSGSNTRRFRAVLCGVGTWSWYLVSNLEGHIRQDVLWNRHALRVARFDQCPPANQHRLLRWHTGGHTRSHLTQYPIVTPYERSSLPRVCLSVRRTAPGMARNRNCQHCNGVVSSQFVRVYGTNGKVFACPDCETWGAISNGVFS